MTQPIPPLLAHALVTLVVVGLALLGYDRAVSGRALRVGTVDLNAVFREKEADFTRRVTRASSDAERERAMQDARAFAQRLPAALEALPHKCQCVVMLSSAVAAPAPHTLDLTFALRQELALE